MQTLTDGSRSVRLPRDPRLNFLGERIKIRVGEHSDATQRVVLLDGRVVDADEKTALVSFGGILATLPTSDVQDDLSLTLSTSSGRATRGRR